MDNTLYDEPNFVIVTGSSQNHFKSLKQFLRSCDSEDISKIIVYDLGLLPESAIELKEAYPNIDMYHFDYEKYPSYFNILVNAGEYAWKPCIIYETMTARVSVNTILLWCDAGNIMPHNITSIKEYIKKNHIFSPISSRTISDMTHFKTLEYFGIDKENSDMIHRINRNGAMLGFNLSNPIVRDFIETLKKCALTKECIAPEGSNRTNHRQDQSVFSILYYQFLKQYPEVVPCDDYLNIRIHQDID